MRQANELDLHKGNKLIDTENKQLTLVRRYNVNTWLAVNSKQNLEVVSVIDIFKYKVVN